VNVFDRIRAACRTVAERARFVRVEESRLEPCARALLAAEAPRSDPAHQRRATPEATLAYVVTLDAVNFGSGWFPFLRKRPGCSGYFTVALALAERCDARGPWSAAELREIEAAELARVCGQDLAVPEVRELVGLFATALRDLGELLDARYAGSFAALVDAAGGRAARLVEILGEMPFYRDVASLGGREVPFYKRAQITAADLHRAFEGRGAGRFGDLDSLTIFADNLVPHVLRLEGVLVYEPALVQRIEAGELLAPGSREEVEIRACALDAVERLGVAAARLGREIPVWRLDEILWWRGQRPEFKARPRHRTRSVFY
jgi:hypothetical protein